MYEFTVRIAYADTDRMGIVYYANYFVLFERGRTELLRNHGVRYRDLEQTEKIFLPAMQSHCDYRAPAYYDDLICIRTRVSEIGNAHVTFHYEIVNAENKKFLAQGYTKHPLVNKDWKPVRIPKKLKSILETVRESSFPSAPS